MFSHPSGKEDSYSPPANTSASFLNQKHEVEKLLARQDRLANQKPEVRNREGDCAFLKMYAEDDLCGGKFEDSRDSRHHSKTRANSSSKIERQSRSDRASSDRRDSTGSYHRQADDRNKASDSGRLEKEPGRREGYHKFSPNQAKPPMSPTGSDYSSKSVERYKQYTSRWMNEPSRYNADGRAEVARGKREKESKNRERDPPRAKGDEEALLNGKEPLGSGAKKQLPQNLLNIFNQIAEFEREKGTKQKNQ